MSERVLLTGGAGMVGGSVRRALSSTEVELLAPDRHDLDLRDEAAVRRYLAAARPDTIVHVAGRVGGILANVSDQVGFLVENGDIGRNLILAAAAAGVPRFLNVSSSCVYPREAENPLREDQLFTGPLEPTNEGYALGKLLTLRLGELLARERTGFAFRSLIPCNLYGPGDRFDAARSHMLPAAIRKLHEAVASGADEVVIWGDGTARREFMYVEDLADCIRGSLGRFDTLPERMNVGTGRDHTVTEYYQVAAEVIGFRGGFSYDRSKPSGMRRKVVDVSRLEAWGWTAGTSLKAGIAATYEYFRQSGAQVSAGLDDVGKGRARRD